MKKAFLVLSLLMGLLLIGCGKQEGKTEEKAKVAEKKEPIRILNAKPEIDGALKKYATKYEEVTGQPVTIETIGGGADAGSVMKGYLLSGNMPDIFAFSGIGEFKTFGEHMYDLSNESWVKNTKYGFENEGKVFGFPYAVEGFGINYNADILAKAGIDPKSLTNYDAYKKAFEILESKKSELGLQAVASVAAETGGMWWSTGIHMIAHYISGGVARDNKDLINMLKEGKIDKARFSEYADFVDLLFKHADKTVLISGSYDDQLALFAQGKAAFITQGNWIDPSLPKYNVTFGLGIAPFAFSKKTEITGILADSPAWWAVYKDGKNIEAAKKFLEFTATSKEGQEALVTDCGMISPYTTTTVTPSTPLAKSLMGYIKDGNTYAWDFTAMPDGLGKDVIAPAFYLLANKQVNKDKFVDMLEKNISEYVKNKK